MMSCRSAVCFLLWISLGETYVTSGLNETLSIIWDKNQGSLDVVQGLHKSWVATAKYENAVNKTGWAYLEVYTNGRYEDSVQAYAAGLAEGIISRDLITKSWHNTFSGYCKHPLSRYCRRLKRYLKINARWMAQQINENGNSDPYWHQVRLFLDQFSGLMDGYKGNQRGLPVYTVDVTSLLLLQIGGDLLDLAQVLNRKDSGQVVGSGSCSALIKVLNSNKELYIGHNTWLGLNYMLRVLKKYHFAFSTTELGGKRIPGEVMTFSSYPGLLYSADDFYTISSGLVALETTIPNDNHDLWKYITPENTVFESIRNMVANRLAKSGQEWCDIFSRYNSGTFNNEWMIVDYKKFRPGGPLPSNGLLYVLEQMPGMVVAKDLTSVLEEQGYWPSYNIPYFPQIFNASGGPAKVAKYGDWFTYDQAPRAKLFRRDHVKVKDMRSMVKLMRYNDYTHDPLSACNCTPAYSAENAIDARGDLNSVNGIYPFPVLGHRNHAGIDVKVTNYKLAQENRFLAVSGPTYDNVPAFQWSKSDFDHKVMHEGHPDLWVFKPINHQWGTSP